MTESIEFSTDELKAIREEYCKGANDSQFQNFIREAKIRNLIPGKHLHFQLRTVKEYDDTLHTITYVKRAVHLTAIDFFRLTAQRTGEYRGQKRPVWVYLDDQGLPTLRSEVPLPDKIPYAAEASVLRKNFESPITTVARFDAYAVYYKDNGKFKLNSMWEKRGPEQLYKCSEAQALRQAFPEELGGLYIAEEIRPDEEDSKAGAPTPPVAANSAPAEEFPVLVVSQDAPANTVSPAGTDLFPTKEERTSYVNRLRYYMKNTLPKLGIKNAEEVVKQWAVKHTGVENSKDWTKAQWNDLLGILDDAKEVGTLGTLFTLVSISQNVKGNNGTTE